jgi:hypothetical protein
MDHEILGLPVDFVLIMIGGFIFYVLFALSPVICSVTTVVRHRNEFQRRFLYVAAVTFLSYGFFLFAVAVLYVPASAFFTFIAPMLHESGHLPWSWLLDLLVFIVHWWSLIWLPVLAVVAFSTNRYLARRWSRIAPALQA